MQIKKETAPRWEYNLAKMPILPILRDCEHLDSLTKF